MEIKRASFVRGYQRDMWISIYNGISRLCYRHADLVISLFEQNRRKQIDMGADEDTSFVIPNGIDIPRFSAVVRQKREGFHVGLVGRVVPIKDIKTFILTAKVVADAVPEAAFWCIGPTDEDPAYFDDCRALVDSFQLSSRFTFTGKTDVREYYAFLDVLLLTSVREAQPLVILEAYAAGLPVVSTRVGNVPELLDYDERFLASSKDAAKLAEAVGYVHAHPDEMRAIAARNRDKVDRFYDKTRGHRVRAEEGPATGRDRAVHRGESRGDGDRGRPVAPFRARHFPHPALCAPCPAGGARAFLLHHRLRHLRSRRLLQSRHPLFPRL